ncbi:MAG: hypothetical protein QNJ84_05930 [Alphaproteobacteria bacterium]|nr:hypothetical protein [Alphaproteobacteria bacterium]
MQRRRAKNDTRLIRVLTVNAVSGAALGCVCAAVILKLDIGGLGGLLLASEESLAAAILFFTGFATTFGSCAVGSAIMGIGRDDS